MRKVLWYSSINELDYEMQMLFEHLPDYEFRLAIPDAGNDYFFPVNVRVDYTSVVTAEQIAAVLHQYRPDILVHRYRRDPTNLLQAAAEAGVPVLVWVTEQGPDRDLEWERNRHFRNLAVNNLWDLHYYRNRGVENVFYWPFGCLPFFHRPVEVSERFRADVVGYGNPIYNLYDSKRSSIDTLVTPLIREGVDLALWGLKSGAGGGWLDVPGVREDTHYKGRFNYDELPAVNSSANIVLGITSNGRYGAFGSRLARALACRSFCIWAYSEGMEEMEEGYRNRVNCCWSKHADETLELVRYYLKNHEERARIAAAGQALAYQKLNYETMVPPILEAVMAQQPARPHSRYFSLVSAMSQTDDPHQATHLGYQIRAHDATGFTHHMALRQAQACLRDSRFRLALHYLAMSDRQMRYWERRLARSGDGAASSGEMARQYRALHQILDQVLEQSLSGASDAAKVLLEGILHMQDSPATRMVAVQFARCLADSSYRQGRTHAALRAFNVYMALHCQPDLAYHDLLRPLALCLPPLAEPEPAEGERRSIAERGMALIGHHELFLEAAALLPLDRSRVALAGDATTLWAEYLCHNVAPTIHITEGSYFSPAAGVVSDVPDPRATSMSRHQTDLPADVDALLYLALTDDSNHWTRLRRLTDQLSAGGCVLLACGGTTDEMAHRMESLGLRVAFLHQLNGRQDLDMETRHPLAGPISLCLSWKSLASRERLIEMVTRLARRLDPRICHVTLDAHEILLGRYAWAEGCVQVMRHICQTEGMQCRTFSLQASAQQHTLLEVRVEGRPTTWDPLLGIGYESSLLDLLSYPERGDAPLGDRPQPRWKKYELDRFSGHGFFGAVREMAERDDLEAPPRWQSVRVGVPA